MKKPQAFVLFRGKILWRDLICILLSATHEVRSKIQQSKSKIDILLQNTGKDFHICIQTSFSSIGREWTERRDYKRRTITSINVMQRIVQNAHKRSHFYISIPVTFTFPRQWSSETDAVCGRWRRLFPVHVLPVECDHPVPVVQQHCGLPEEGYQMRQHL